MELPFASMFILKLFLISLLTITINAKTVDNKLLSEICQKTKSPEKCLRIMSRNPARSASTLHNLGLGTLDLAIVRAKSSANVFNGVLLKRNDLQQRERDIIKECRQNYVVAMTKLGEAKAAWVEKKYAAARKGIELAVTVPNSCEKALAGAPLAVRQVKQANEMSDITFDATFVVVKEIEGNGNKA